jgi:hypothetical protein
MLWRPTVLYVGNLVTLLASQKVQGGMKGVVNSELGRGRHGLIEGIYQNFQGGTEEKLE